VCFDNDKRCAIIPCGHTFCRMCVDKVTLCPTCRAPKQSALDVFL
jgi:hypothetical protein